MKFKSVKRCVLFQNFQSVCLVHTDADLKGHLVLVLFLFFPDVELCLC